MKSLKVLGLVAILFSAMQLNAAPSSQNQSSSADQANTIKGKIVKFKEHDELIIDDGKGRILVDYPEKYQRWGLQVGQEIVLWGKLDQKSDGSRFLIAESIQPNTTTSPTTPSSTTKTAATNGKTMLIKDVVKTAAKGQDVVVEGVIFDFPSTGLLVIQDGSGNITVESSNDQKTAYKIGDKVTVQGQVNLNDKQIKTLKASKIDLKQ